MRKLNKKRAQKELYREFTDTLKLYIPREELHTGHVPNSEAWLHANPKFQRWYKAMAERYGRVNYDIELTFDMIDWKDYVMVRRRASNSDLIRLKP